MRLWLSLGALVLAACSFEPRGLPSLGDDDDDVPGVDAATDAALPPDAPLGCLDTDHDSVCNDVDRCPGDDDRQDADGDAVPDGCDAWDCGPGAAPTVTLPIAVGDGLTINQVSIETHGAVEEVGRNSTAVVAVRFTFTDGDAGERDQVELGVADGNRLNCRATDDEVLGWTVPPIGFGTGTSHHVVSLTAQLAHESNCNSGQRDRGWADAAPTAPIIGVICVR